MPQGPRGTTDVPCPALVDDNNANWGIGTDGINAGVCVSGYYVPTSPYAPQRHCTATGWGAVTTACQRTSLGAPPTLRAPRQTALTAVDGP